MALYRFFMKEILVGAAVAGAALKATRPVLTAAVGAGLVVKDVARQHWGRAMAELVDLVHDGQSARMSSVPPSSESGGSPEQGPPRKPK